MKFGTCAACGSSLIAWTENHKEGVTLFCKCESCQKLWQLKFNFEGDMVAATVEGRGKGTAETA